MIDPEFSNRAQFMFFYDFFNSFPIGREGKWVVLVAIGVLTKLSLTKFPRWEKLSWPILVPDKISQICDIISLKP